MAYPPVQLRRLEAAVLVPSRRDDLVMVDDQHRSDAQLLANIKRDLSALTALAEEVQGHWAEEDMVYRFSHRSFKVYGIHDLTLRIVGALEAVRPDDCDPDEHFRPIIAEGTGNAFEYEQNQRWQAETRPMVEEFWHADYMLRMAVKYGRELDEAPDLLPSGWAAAAIGDRPSRGAGWTWSSDRVDGDGGRPGRSRTARITAPRLERAMSARRSTAASQASHRLRSSCPQCLGHRPELRQLAVGLASGGKLQPDRRRQLR